MNAYKDMTPQERAAYDDARMTHGQRQQAAQDWRDAQAFILSCLVVLCGAVTILEPLLH